MDNNVVVGKYLLEILTKGMYSNPLHIYREYIQNAADSIDKAEEMHIINHSEAAIHIVIHSAKREVIIRDNGVGIPKDSVQRVLMSIGASDKDGIAARGFRGIGRLGGLAYADQVEFSTSAAGDNVRTTMVCDCVRLQRLLRKDNQETSDVIETVQAISSFHEQEETLEKHYFEVRMTGVNEETLLNEDEVMRYLAANAPVDFDKQKFPMAQQIQEFFKEMGVPLTTYKIYRGDRKLPIYKLYSRTLQTGMQERTRTNDGVRSIDTVYKVASDGQLLYIGWLAVTDFSGMIKDEQLQGIRLRKGNIQVGDRTTFSKFFPTEKEVANRTFAGEIHAVHSGLIPNSQRDDFEPGKVYDELREALSDWAFEINKKYRRGTSEANSSLRKLNDLNKEQKELQDMVANGAITSDEKREQIQEKLYSIEARRKAEEKKVRRALSKGVFDDERRETVEKVLTQTESATKRGTELSAEIINAEYATKNDLPSSYSRDERKLYQRIIAVIDSFFADKPDIAQSLREKIRSELKTKKKDEAKGKRSK